MLALLLALVSAPPPDLTTVAERSKLTRTGRYEEVERLCRDFPRAYPGRVRCDTFGTTPEGRPMLALVASQDGVLEPATAREKQRPVVLVQGGIHAGEIDGKDAGFMALRALLDQGRVLSRITWVFVPVFNVDGHERFGPNNRPNQRGPVDMGWRTTAHNLNLNRDYTKADAPEMQAMLTLLGQWDPVLYVDLHVTDGAEFQHDVAVMVDPAEVGPEVLRGHGRALRDACLARLSARGHLPLPFYPSFEEEDDPASGFALGTTPPRFALGYWSARDRLSMLVETHSWKPYAARVKATLELLHAVAEQGALHGAEWLTTARALDGESVAGRGVPLTWTNTPRARTIEFKGYAYTREPSAISGRLRTTYDAKRPQVWRVPLYDELVPKVTVQAPGAGYYLPAAARVVAERLRLHGFRLRRLATPLTTSVEVHRAATAQLSARSFEGRQTLEVAGVWTTEPRTLPAGTWWIDLAQPGGRLLLHLLEPSSPDSLLSWGFFNAHYERKEYLEPYVAEAWAEALLARDPTARAAFVARLAADPAFAADPAARLGYFHRLHPSWDAQYQVYPVLRAAAAPPAGHLSPTQP